MERSTLSSLALLTILTLIGYGIIRFFVLPQGKPSLDIPKKDVVLPIKGGLIDMRLPMGGTLKVTLYGSLTQPFWIQSPTDKKPIKKFRWTGEEPIEFKNAPVGTYTLFTKNKSIPTQTFILSQPKENCQYTLQLPNLEQTKQCTEVGTLVLNVQNPQVKKVQISKCTRAQEEVKNSLVRFESVPNSDCGIKFLPSGAYTIIRGGKRVYSCSLQNDSSTILCTE